MKKAPFLLILCMISFLVVSGCSNESGTSSSSTPDTKNLDNEKILTIANSSDLKSFDPQNNRHTPSDVIIRNMFNRLFKRDNPENMEIVPELVENYEMLSENTWKFKIKEGVKFHNGDSLTAEDVVFTLNRIATDKTVSENVYYSPVIESANLISDYEFEIKTKGPSPTLLTLLSKAGTDILPKKYIEEVGWDEFLKNPVGSGPYKFVEWIKDDRVVLESNDDYWEGDVSVWDKVVIRSIPENSTRVSELLTGGVDIAFNIPPSEWDRIDNEETLNIVKAPTSRVLTLIVRTGDEYPTKDPKVREAIDLAIDKEVLVNSILRGAGTPIRTRVVDASFGAHPDLQNTSIYDPERAKELLKEAGYSEGEIELTLQAPQGRYLLDSEIAEMIANMLTEAGIKVNLEIMESSSFSTAYSTSENKDLMFVGLGDPMMEASYSLNHFYSENAEPLMNYSNKEIDELFMLAGSNMNFEERAKQYHRIQEIIAEERPQIPLYSEMASFGVKKSLTLKPYISEEIKFNEIVEK